jgi:uncharacterized protein YjiS (DUF1127 family)
MGCSMIEVRVLPASGLGVFGLRQVTRSIKRLIAWTVSERRVRAGVDELRALDHHILADIGLTRGDIEYAARFGRLPKGWNDGACR